MYSGKVGDGSWVTEAPKSVKDMLVGGSNSPIVIVSIIRAFERNGFYDEVEDGWCGV
jgi:hypothetical protein